MTGTADTEAYEFQQIYNLEVVVIPTNKPCIRQDDADVIYLTKEEKFEAIIDEIKECIKAQQPVLVGTVSIENSEILSHILKKHQIKHQVLNAKFHEQEAQIVAEAGRPWHGDHCHQYGGSWNRYCIGRIIDAELRALTDPAQKKWRMSKPNGKNVMMKWSKQAACILLEQNVMNRDVLIINYEDDRVGKAIPDPLSFYLSLEDNLMRIFGSDHMAGLMRKLGVEKGEAITHPWVTRAIENAQRKVEGHNFDMRKQLLEYDNVANDQRHVIYEQRDALMAATDISENIKNMRHAVIAGVIDEYIPRDSVEDLWDPVGLENALQSEFGIKLPVSQWLSVESELNEEALRERVQDALDAHYNAKEAQIGSELMRRLEKSLMLNSLDTHWRDQLAHMEHLRQSIFLRGYAQKDPKQEYKREAFNLFSAMLESIKRQVVSHLYLMQVEMPSDVEAIEAQQHTVNPEMLEYKHMSESALLGQEAEGELLQEEPMMAMGGSRGTSVARLDPKVGRNDNCPCGSGKKFKHCHGRLS